MFIKLTFLHVVGFWKISKLMLSEFTRSFTISFVLQVTTVQ